MLTRKGKALDMIGSDETILWKSAGPTKSGISCTFLVFTVLWMLCFLPFLTSGSFTFGEIALIIFEMTLPIWVFLVYLKIDNHISSNTWYYVTSKGIYLQKCFISPKTDIYYFNEFQKAASSEDGYVECTLKKPEIDYENGKQIENWTIRFAPPGGREDAARIIQEQIEKLQQLGAAADSPFPLRTDLPAEENITGTAVIDAGQAFFADLKHKRSTVKNRGDFLDESAIADTAAMKQSAADDFSQLQHELFGDEALQTQASPDPTVYPLPELPEQPPQSDDNSQFLQQGF